MILFTGATGFIGRRLLKLLTANYPSQEIICLVHDSANPAIEANGLELLRSYKITALPVDLLTGKGLEKIPKRPDVVFHLASGTDTSEREHRINDIGTKNLLEAVGPLGPNSHFIFTSSIAVNDCRRDFTRPIDEYTETPVRPCHEYGRRKLMAEKYLQEKSKEQGFQLSIVRICGVYGPDSRHGGLFSSLDELVRRGSFVSKLNWPGKIGLIYVEDMAQYLVLVSQRKISGQTIYLPAVESLSCSEMSTVIHQAYNLTYAPARLPNWVWNMGRFFARRKNVFERILPHKIYNKFWQFCLIVNGEYWYAPRKNAQYFPDWRPRSFKQYYSNKIKKDGRELSAVA